MNAVKSFHCVVILAFLVACAQLGTSITPQSFNERLAAGYIAVTETRYAAVRLLGARAMTQNDAEQVLMATDAARQGLDVADQLRQANQEAGAAKLQSTLALLSSLREYVALKEKK